MPHRAIAFALVLAATLCGESLPPAAQAQDSESGVRTLYLIRHGDYDIDDPADPEVGKALIPLGIAQSRLVAARLQGMPVRFDRMLSSPMTRARETAAVIAEGLTNLDTPIEITPLLRECIPPTWRQDIMEREEPAELQACQEQLERAFEEYFVPSAGRDRHEILVCHGNVTRWLVTQALQVDPMAWLGMSIDNCSLTVVRIHPDGSMKLVSFNDRGHLPPSLHTEPGGDSRRLVVPESRD
jgi:serine/threonine-protein phosphatase PGAM5